MANIPGGAYQFKDISTRDTLPLGTYQCQVSKTDISTNQRGDTYLVFTFRVLYGAQANRVHSVRYCHEYVSDPSRKAQMEAMGRRQTKLLGLALGYDDSFVLTDTDQYLNRTCQITLTESKNPDFPNVEIQPWSPGPSMAATPTTPAKQAPKKQETYTESDDDIPW